MLKALMPVDGAGNSLAAIRHVVKLVQRRESLEIHVLNAQPPLPSDITPARALLDAADIAYTQHEIVGHAGRCIAEQAKKLQCDKVIMGTHGFGTRTWSGRLDER